MVEESKVESTLNLQGLICPLPVVKVSQAVKSLAVGGIVEAFATDPGVLVDIPAWCRSTGNDLVKMEKQEKIFRFLVRRVK